MRLEGVIAVMVLATGMMLGGVVLAAKPRPEPKLKTSPLANPWTQAELRPEHAVLAELVGHGTSSVHVEEGPYPRAKDTEGTAEAKPLMGGLFVQVTHSEKRMRQPFEGMVIYGFDEAVGKYTADVLDSTSTAIIHYVGTYDAAKKQLIMSTRYSEQKSRRLTIGRLVTTFVDAKTWTYEVYVSHAVGEAETRAVSITFKRG